MKIQRRISSLTQRRYSIGKKMPFSGEFDIITMSGADNLMALQKVEPEIAQAIGSFFFAFTEGCRLGISDQWVSVTYGGRDWDGIEKALAKMFSKLTVALVERDAIPCLMDILTGRPKVGIS